MGLSLLPSAIGGLHARTTKQLLPRRRPAPAPSPPPLPAPWLRFVRCRIAEGGRSPSDEPPPPYSGSTVDLDRVGGQGVSPEYGGTDAPQFDDVMPEVDGIDRRYVTSAMVPPYIVVQLNHYLISGKITGLLYMKSHRDWGLGHWER